MYAVIRTGGKQYTVKAGDVVHVDKVDQALGAEFELTDVLLVGGATTHIGQPLVKGAKVVLVVTKQAKTRKVVVFKKKRRHSYRNFNTHRQEFTALFVKSITGPDGTVEKSNDTPNVVDMAAKRADRITAKQDAAQERRENKGTAEAAPAAAKKAAPKKKAAKKAGAKKKASGKKASKKPAGKKKTTKTS